MKLWLNFFVPLNSLNSLNSVWEVENSYNLAGVTISMFGLFSNILGSHQSDQFLAYPAGNPAGGTIGVQFG
jgi:hypothetical protein